jgi:hypothetical protein
MKLFCQICLCLEEFHILQKGEVTKLMYETKVEFRGGGGGYIFTFCGDEILH